MDRLPHRHLDGVARTGGKGEQIEIADGQCSHNRFAALDDPPVGVGLRSWDFDHREPVIPGIRRPVVFNDGVVIATERGPARNAGASVAIGRTHRCTIRTVKRDLRGEVTLDRLPHRHLDGVARTG